MPGPGNYEQVTTQLEAKMAAAPNSAALMSEVNKLLSETGAGGNTSAYDNILANMAADDRNNTAKDYLPGLILSAFGDDSRLATTIGYNGYTKDEIARIAQSTSNQYTPAEVLAAKAFLQRFDGVAGSVLQAHQRFGQRWDDDNASLDDVKMWASGDFEGDTSWQTSMGYRPDIENLLVAFSSPEKAGQSTALQALAANRVASFDAINQDLENYKNGYIQLTQQQVDALNFMKDHGDVIAQFDMHGMHGENQRWQDNQWVHGIDAASINTVATRLGTNLNIAKSVDQSIADAGVSQSVVEHVPENQVAQSVPQANGDILKLDAAGRPLEVDYPGGEFTRFSRNANGDVTQIQSSDGLFSFKNTAGAWTRENPTEAVTAPIVNADGSYSLTYTRGGATFTETHRTDGSTFVTNAQGLITEVTHSDAANSKITFFRDAANNITSIQLSSPQEFIDPVSQQATFDNTTGILTYTKNGRKLSILPNGTVQSADAPVVQTAGNGQPTVTVTPPADAVAKHNAAAAFNNLEAYQQLALRQNGLFMDAAGNMKRRPAANAPELAAWNAQLATQPENVRNFINQIQDNWTSIDNVPGSAAEGAVNINEVVSQGLVATDATATSKNADQTDFRNNHQTFTLDHQHIGEMATEVLKARGITPANTPDFATAVKNETLRIMILNGYRPDGGTTATKDANGNTLKGWNNITWPQTFKIYDPADPTSQQLLNEIDLKLQTTGHYDMTNHMILPS
ncbi:MAG: hypothetical protein K2Y39_27640 [Candidatus Obscuribacterales bacterium]|nr:hypothetical protein [Candidatus Obscuribacterales bacterium]